MQTAERLTTDLGDAGDGLTERLARQAVGYRFAELPAEAVVVAKQCILDWLGVTIAGAAEPLSEILRAEAADQGGAPQARLIGTDEQTSVAEAALVNGATSHALDYDDVHPAMGGHPTAPVAPAIFAIAEQRGANGADLIAAFVAGFETECRLGLAVGPSHYQAGWHSTATIGSFGAAAGAANLLGLTADQTARAFGIAATQAAGLKAMFGTMCKPLHAGNAARTGVTAARLAARGFTSRTDAIEAEQGFADTQAASFAPEAAFDEPAAGLHIRSCLFKYHAACYLTHSSLEICHRLRARHEIDPASIRAVTLGVGAGHFKVCNILAPRTGLETKFSLRHTAAFALAGEDTARLDTFSDANATRADLVALRDKVRVEQWPDGGRRETKVGLELDDGRTFEETFDVAQPAADLDDQWRRLEAKFRSLVAPALGTGAADRLIAACHDLDGVQSVATIADLTAPGS